MAEDELLSLEQATALLGVSRATLFNLIKRYNVPRYQIPVQGKRVFFKRADLETLRQPRPADETKKAAA
jgi:predicted DNA-binding transcriptional regulator AlpA